MIEILIEALSYIGMGLLLFLGLSLGLTMPRRPVPDPGRVYPGKRYKHLTAIR